MLAWLCVYFNVFLDDREGKKRKRKKRTTTNPPPKKKKPLATLQNQLSLAIWNEFVKNSLSSPQIVTDPCYFAELNISTFYPHYQLHHLCSIYASFK